MYDKKQILLLLFMIGFVFLTACEGKEAVMLETESFGIIECDSTEKIMDVDSYEVEEKEIDTNQDEVGYIYVYICGEVKSPGVYQMRETARVYEVLMEAGGYTIEADENVLNLAKEVSDGMQIQVPQKNYNMEQTEIVDESDDRVNINTASVQKLEEIPGIGAVKAEAIAIYRTEYGNFEVIEDIMKVEGIKTGTYEKIKEYIRVN